MDLPERFSNLPAYAFPRLRALLDSHPAGGEVLHMSIGEPKHKFPNFNRNDLFLNELKNFLAFVNGEENAAVSLKEGVVSLRVALAAKESMTTGKVFKFS